MDFKTVLSLIVGAFHKQNVRYALIGGFAMGVLGIMRATMDLDFLVDYNDISKVEKIMKKCDYRRVYSSKNVSQYVSDIKILGEVDFLHAFRTISLSMLKRAKEITLFEGKFKVKVLSPEDIIGLKLQALINDKSRENRGYSDIELIADFYRKSLNWNLIKEYFSLFKEEKRFKELNKKYNNVK